MKKLLFTLSVLALSLFSKAQDDTSYVDVGVNVIRILNMGIGAQNLDYDVWNPYMFTIDGHYKRIGLRIGYGGRSVTNTELPTLANGATTFEMDTLRRDFRIGLNWDIHLSSDWTCKFGVDYITTKEIKRNSAEFTNEAGTKIITEHKVQRDELGISPFIYMQYHISPRVSIGTELLWRITSFTISDNDNSNLNEAKIERNYEGTRRNVMAPTALFLNVRF